MPREEPMQASHDSRYRYAGEDRSAPVRNPSSAEHACASFSAVTASGAIAATSSTPSNARAWGDAGVPSPDQPLPGVLEKLRNAASEPGPSRSIHVGTDAEVGSGP